MYRLRAPADARVLDLVHDLLARFWTDHAGMPLGHRARFDTAVAEIAANVVEHTRAVAALTLEIRGLPDRVEAALEDDGEPVVVDLDDVRMPPAGHERGRGLALARAAVDDVRYERRGDANHWYLALRRPDG